MGRLILVRANLWEWQLSLIALSLDPPLMTTARFERCKKKNRTLASVESIGLLTPVWLNCNLIFVSPLIHFHIIVWIIHMHIYSPFPIKNKTVGEQVNGCYIMKNRPSFTHCIYNLFGLLTDWSSDTHRDLISNLIGQLYFLKWLVSTSTVASILGDSDRLFVRKNWHINRAYTKEEYSKKPWLI